MSEINITEVVKKLVGDISARGCSARDADSLENLKVLTSIVGDLIVVLQDKAENRNSVFGSISKIGLCASDFLSENGIILWRTTDNMEKPKDSNRVLLLSEDEIISVGYWDEEKKQLIDCTTGKHEGHKAWSYV